MGELARQPDAPKFPDSPMELLTPKPGEGYSLWEKYYFPVVGALAGIVVTCLANATFRRPAYAGLHIHALFAGVGSGSGILFRNYKMAEDAERDAIFRHYMSLHPEDFPPYERRRYRDIFEPWNPVR